jgi:hypothetical protein
MSGRDEQTGRQQGLPEGRQETARERGQDPEAEDSTEPTAPADPRTIGEQKAEAALLKSSGGDPLTQESD